MEQRQARPRLIQAMIDAFSLPDLRGKLLFTLLILIIFRFVAQIPAPGVDQAALAEVFKNNQLYGMLDLFSGGAMRNFSVLAMGVYPYITATIVMQLLQPVIPQLMALSKEGEAGRNKINVYTHWLAVPLAALQGYGQVVLLQREGVFGDGLTVTVGHGGDNPVHGSWHYVPGLAGRTDYGAWDWQWGIHHHFRWNCGRNAEPGGEGWTGMEHGLARSVGLRYLGTGHHPVHCDLH